MSGGPAAAEAPAPVDTTSIEAEIAALGERVGGLIQSLSEHGDPEVGRQLDELLDGIDHLHREALSRIAGLLEHHDLLVHACEDPVVGATLDLYELRPETDEAAAAAPEAAATPAGGRPPGLIPLNAAAPAPAPAPATPVAPVPLTMAPAGSRSMLNVTDLSVGRPSTQPAGGAPAAPAPERPAAEAAAEEEPAEWFEVASLDDVPAGTVFAPDEGAILLTNVEGEIHAFRNGCGNGPLALHMGRVVDGTRLACPWHIACVYDMVTGISGDPPDQRRLMRYPLRVEDGKVMVAFNRGRVPDPEPSPST